MFALADYTFDLPDDLIAQDAVDPHHDARLLVINRRSGAIEAEDIFWHLDQYIDADRVLFFNDSRVIRSRILLQDVMSTHPDGSEGVIRDGEIFFLKKTGEHQFEALVRPGNKLRVGRSITLGKYQLHIRESTSSGRIIEITGGSIEACMEEYGSLPLPPYIEYSREKEDAYQTVFAKKDGSVAAPTASLHFTQKLISKLPNQKEYVTLHVGLGTFKGIDTDDIRDYQIHSETIEVEKAIFEKIVTIKAAKKKIIGVGTTVTRTLESLPSLWEKLSIEEKNRFDANTRNYWNSQIEEKNTQDWVTDIESSETSYVFSTEIYITPEYAWHIVDELITNFHLPESSLLVLVNAFLEAGAGSLLDIYQHAIRERYRFFSFGDGMYIRQSEKPPPAHES